MGGAREKLILFGEHKHIGEMKESLSKWLEERRLSTNDYKKTGFWGTDKTEKNKGECPANIEMSHIVLRYPIIPNATNAPTRPKPQY